MIFRNQGLVAAISVLGAAIWLGAVVHLLVVAVEASSEATSLSEAVLVTQDEQMPVTLPYRWTPRHAPETAPRFTLRFEAGSDTAVESFVHIPFFAPLAEARLNGRLLYDSELSDDWPGPLSQSTALFRLPPDRLVPGENLLEITLPMPENTPTAKIAGGLSSVLIGPREALKPIYAFRSFVYNDLPLLVLGVQLLLAGLTLVLFLRNRQDFVFGWASAVLLLSLGALLGTVPEVLPWVQYFIVLHLLFGPLTAMSLLGLSRAVANGRNSPGLFRAMPVVFLGLLGLYLVAETTYPDIRLFVSIPITLSIYALSLGLLIRSALRRFSADVLILLVGIAMVLVGSLHDLAVWNGLLGHGIMITQITRLVTLAGVALLILRRYAELEGELSLAAERLRQRLAARERELETLHEAQRRREQEALLQEERARVTRDLHDGVAGHLVAISALSRSDQDLRSDILASAQIALAELRMVIDTAQTDETDLFSLLRVFRNRFVEPMTRSGYDIRWDMTGLPADATERQWQYPHDTCLHVIRILHEGLTNAISHGLRGQISIMGRIDEDKRLVFSVTNEAVKSAGPAKAGRGLVNMKARAEQIGGTLSFVIVDKTARLELSLPGVAATGGSLDVSPAKDEDAVIASGSGAGRVGDK